MSDYNCLKIKELSLNSLCENPSIVIVTPRGGGKSWLCRIFLNHFRDFPAGAIISHSEKSAPFFQTFFPDTFIYNKYKPNTFQKIIVRQIKIIEKAKRKAAQGKKIDTRIFLLMDDCLSDSKTWSKDKALCEILYDGRHLDITYILTMQQPMAIPPDLRANFDYVLFLYNDNMTELKKYYEHYTSMFPTFAAFKEVYDKLTVDHGVMVIKKRNAGPTISDKVFHYKSSEIHPQTIGCKQLIRFHKNNYDADWLQKSFNNQFDINTFITRRNTVPFAVQKVDYYGNSKKF